MIPLGGLEQIGMNMTAFEYEDTIIVVDCGMAFPEDDMLGVDLVIPDISYLEENEKNEQAKKEQAKEADGEAPKLEDQSDEVKKAQAEFDKSKGNSSPSLPEGEDA